MDALPLDLLIGVVDCLSSSDAAVFACVSRDAAAAYRSSRAFRSVRISPKSGEVRSPASGTFDMMVKPGQDVNDAVRRCPRGGCVLLRPGVHTLRHQGGRLGILLGGVEEVHVFGRGQARLAGTGLSITVVACTASLVGIEIADEVVVSRDLGRDPSRLRLQRCKLGSLRCNMGCKPTVDRCTFRGGMVAATVAVGGQSVVARLVGNTFENARILVHNGAHADIVDNRFQFGYGVMFAISVDGLAFQGLAPMAPDASTHQTSAIIVGNVIECLDGTSCVGINVRHEIRQCVMERNEIRGCCYAIQLSTASQARIDGNRLDRNKVGLIMFEGSRATFERNCVIGKTFLAETRTQTSGLCGPYSKGVVILNRNTGGTFSRNEIREHAIGWVMADRAGPNIFDNTIVDCDVGIFDAGSASGQCSDNRMCAVKTPIKRLWWNNVLQYGSAALAMAQKSMGHVLLCMAVILKKTRGWWPSG